MPVPTNPKCPCTKIHPWYLDLGLNFFFPLFWKKSWFAIKLPYAILRMHHSTLSLFSNSWTSDMEWSLVFRNFACCTPYKKKCWSWLLLSVPAKHQMACLHHWFASLDKALYKDALIVDEDWDGNISWTRVQNIPPISLWCDNDVEGTCQQGSKRRWALVGQHVVA